MKKICLGLIMVLGMLMVTGCGKNELVCTKTSDEAKETITFSFDKNDVLKQGKINYAIKVGDEQAIEEGKALLKQSFQDSFKEEDGYKLALSDNGKDTVYLTLTFDASKVSEAINGVDKTKTSLSKIKKEMEEEKYTCK